MATTEEQQQAGKPASVQLYIGETTRRRLKALAALRGLSPSELVRRWVDAEMGRVGLDGVRRKGGEGE